MTAATGPLISFLKSSSNHSGQGNRSSFVTTLEPHHSEFRVLSCFHSSHEVTGVSNLLEASNPCAASPIAIFVLHLVEHVGRSSAMLIVHDDCGHNDTATTAATAALDDLKTSKESGAISIHPLTVVSPFDTMHEDICSLAEEKRVNLVILPFLESFKDDPFRNINKQVMENSLCSVAVLVDRGHRVANPDGRGHIHRRFFVMFIGGPDDREALAYARRMAGDSNVELTVTRFITIDNRRLTELLSEDDEEKKEKMLDDRCVEEFRQETEDNTAVRVTETAVRSGEEIVKAIGELESDEYDLIIVGRGKERDLPITAGGSSSEWSEFPEFGILGETLVCSSFVANAWILVVQQGRRGDVSMGSSGGGSRGSTGGE